MKTTHERFEKELVVEALEEDLRNKTSSWAKIIVEELTEKAVAEERKRIVEFINKNDCETGFNAEYNDQFHEAKGFHRANKETIEFINLITKEQ